MADNVSTPSSPNSNTKPFNEEKSKDAAMSMARFKRGPIGDSGLIRYNGRVYEESREELRFPHSVVTFNKMGYDATIVAARSIFGMFLRKTRIYSKPKEGQEKNKNALKNSEFINWQLKNFDDHSWREIMTNVMTYDLYGFSLMEMIFELVNSGEYKGLIRVKDLSPRAQSSIDKWIWSNDGRKVIGFEQIIRNVEGKYTLAGYRNGEYTVKIPMKKCLHFSYNSTKDNPQGNSPLKGCYVTWKFKCLLEDYEATGVAKDMAGMPTFGIDQDVLVKARTDPASSEAVLVNYLETAGANMHAGEQNFLVHPLAYTDSGKALFDFKLLGIEGSGKSYNIDDIIKRRQNEILMAYFADVLKLGQDGVGSFALADSKNALLAHAVEDHIDFILEVFNRQFIKVLAEMNGWDENDIPEMASDDIENRDLDELGKFIQRVVSVGAMSVDQDLDEALRTSAELPKANYKKPMPSNEANTSRAGDGMKTAGNGTAKEVGGKDNSVSNTENASSNKDYVEMFSIVGVNDEFMTIRTPTGRELDMTLEDVREFFN